MAAALESRSAEAARLALVPNTLMNSTIKASAQVAAGRAIDRRDFHVRRRPDPKCPQEHVDDETQDDHGRPLARRSRSVRSEPGGASSRSGKVAAGGPAGLARRLRRNRNPRRSPPVVTLEDYVVEPPDLLIVEVLEALPGRPISGERLVRPDGKISLGFYGDVYVAGLTIPEVKEKIVRHLQKYLE